MKKSINKKANKDVNVEIDKQVIHKLNIASVSATLTSLICAAITPTYASDIEIYKVPEDSVGSTTLMMMLDLSGSMADNDAGQTGSRILRLRNGMRDVLQGTPTNLPVADKVVVGLGTFAAAKGQIRIGAKALDLQTGTGTHQIQRWYRIGTRSSSYRYATCSENYPAGGCKTWGAISTNNIDPGTGSASGDYGTNSCSFGTN